MRVDKDYTDREIEEIYIKTQKKGSRIRGFKGSRAKKSITGTLESWNP
jgi:hypothetical protein